MRKEEEKPARRDVAWAMEKCGVEAKSVRV